MRIYKVVCWWMPFKRGREDEGREDERREEVEERDERRIYIVEEVRKYRHSYESLINSYNTSNIQTIAASHTKFSQLFALIERWSVVASDPARFQTIQSIVKENNDLEKLQREISKAFDEIRRQYIEFSWSTLKYYVKKKLQQKGFPTEGSSFLEIIEGDTYTLQCRTSGNPIVNSLMFTFPFGDLDPNPKTITCTVVYYGARDNETISIKNYEELENLLNKYIHPDAKYEPPASALHWTALSRLIDLLELHYV